ncbi:uncharacterized protein ASCRUDRAFT_76101 [Ascoidea rubescens DSM 1968]|uniref:Uncharacterized protein n=1 Tax=Ascoidea rubescens DSM 1968 TaxID=1344418 RepID=A0A1D2VGE1_9ASCO|nr:hypothetical protein ASCRUDRAFT_76101 [Ascoidea rubescens DSM 1968]ODV60728.1 hypothetical protein ASCRUDRAFT_76101 [Ascoidea rubescens DSM 1968]
MSNTLVMGMYSNCIDHLDRLNSLDHLDYRNYWDYFEIHIICSIEINYNVLSKTELISDLSN